MKHIIKLFFIFLFITTSLYSSDKITLTKKEKEFIKKHPIIKVGVETNWPPFEFVEEGEYKGLTKGYLDIISQQTGIKFQYIIDDSWSNLLQKTQAKKIDLLPILTKTTQTEKSLLFTDKYISIREYLFSKEIQYNNLDDLKNKTIAIPKDYAYETYIKERYPNITVLSVNNMLEAIDAVVTSKAEALIANPAIISYLTKKHNITDILANFPLKYNKNEMFMATRNDFGTLVDILNKVLNNISVEDKQKLHHKWVFSNKTPSNSNIIFTEEEKEFLEKMK